MVNLTDDEIKTALECCVKDDCHKCERFKVGASRIEHKDKMLSDALDLINRQKAEIEFLRASKGLDKAEFNELKAELELKKTEIEKYRHIEQTVKDFWGELKKLSAFKDLQEPTLTELLEYIDYANTEAIKEFIERFKETANTITNVVTGEINLYTIRPKQIDNLKKSYVKEKPKMPGDYSFETGV